MPASLAQRQALRLIVEEIYREELKILRLQQDVRLLRLGVHPQQRLLEAIVAWEFTLKERFGGRRS